MLDAQRRFDLLVQRAIPDVIEASIEHARVLYDRDQADPRLAGHFRAAADAEGAGNIVRAGRGWFGCCVRTCSVAAIPRVSRLQLRQDDRSCWYAWPTSR